MPLKNSAPQAMPQNFPVVGIGASAGGLDSFKKILEAIPENSGMAYVLVQHLAPAHESILPDLLAKFTTIPLHEITDAINLAPNHIYIIPENKMLAAEGGVLKLTARDLSSKTNMPIDFFFNSLAEVHKSFAIGVVLSGTGFDGTQGLKSIKEMGGVTYAQNLETATFQGMPQNAISSGAVDFILAPEAIPQHLQHVYQAYKTNHAYSDDTELSKDSEDVFKQILNLLRLRTGNDFSHYKQPTIRRRIARRMVMSKKEKPQEYLKYLREEKKEQDALFNDILIPVSYFFRDTKTFETLNDAVFPLILKNKKPDEGIRLWVAGCSTGEEAYSLAINLHEFLSDKSPGIKVQIFASDISENVIAKARAAMYSKQELQHISETRIQNYFTKSDGQYHINKIIRDMCVFAVHNFLKDPPFAKMDLISCRNVLIYLDPFLQKKAMTTFHYALKDQGILLLGKSETAGKVPNLFEPLIKNQKIYTRKPAPGRFLPISYEPSEMFPHTKYPMLQKKLNHEPDFEKLASDILFSKYTPAGVIINDQKEIVHFHGDTSPFLVASPGKPNFNILKMAREGLAFELRNALLKTKKSKKNTAIDAILIKDKNYLVNFEVIPLTSTEPHFLILFHKIEVQLDEKKLASRRKTLDQLRIKQLEAELNQIREDIRRVTEDQEAANEELQSANEELLSNSEELQTLNEELETSAEELQSNNEELISVNDELMDRQEQLVASRTYAEAIVETIREPLVILDKSLRIKTANNSFYKYFKVAEQDTEGHLFFELENEQFNSVALRKLLENVLPKKTKMEDFETTINFPKLGERSLLLNARQIINDRDSEELILMAIEDITEHKITKLLKESEERFRILADTAPVLLWVTGADKGFTFLNKSWLNFTGNSMDKEIGNGWIKGIHPKDQKQVSEIYNSKFDAKEEFCLEYRLKRHDGVYRWITTIGVPRFIGDNEFIGYVGGSMDIDEQKNFSTALEEKVEQRTKELQESESFLQSVLNTTQNLIYIYDLEKKKIVFINKKSQEVIGYSPEEIMNSATDLYSSLIHPDDMAIIKDHHIAFKKISDGQIQTIEYRLKNKKGEWTYQLSRDLVFKRDKKGKVIQYIGVTTDISEIKKANEMLILKNQELEYTNAELASFSAIASHDLKEPLRKIQIFSKLVIAKENVSELSGNFLERVIVSANRMQKLIDDLISYSKTSAEKIEYTKTKLNLVLGEVLEEMKEVIEEKKAVITFVKLPMAHVIPSQFRQLFHNLINNAIKYSKADVAPHIKITSKKATLKEILALKGNPETSYIKISITDNGIGFPEEYSKKIFEPFQRLHDKDEYSGTGIGLAICKKIMLNHHGFIVAESKLGKGAVFSIYLPECK